MMSACAVCTSGLGKQIIPPTLNYFVLCCPLQLEESNRTLTVDVANLANEKEELNNQLKEMQQRASLLFLLYCINSAPDSLKLPISPCFLSLFGISKNASFLPSFHPSSSCLSLSI